MNAQVEALMKFVHGLVAGKFYGTVKMNFEAGKIVIVKKEESIKLGGSV